MKQILEEYVVVNGNKYRKGYTTGSCAAAAAKASVMMLLSGSVVEEVSIDTPAGVRLNLPVTDVCITAESAGCAVLKDGGDDPDMTSGLKIFATARRKSALGIEIRAGEGIGRVTLPGLKVAVGKPAINPVPEQMILKEVGNVLPENVGVEIMFTVPGGAEAALKTFNPKLGIIGGISILGTSGIVNPMSEEAWKEALALELNVLVAKGKKSAVYVFGNYGEHFVTQEIGLDKDNLIKVSNFMGFMLDKAVECGLEKILIVGHLGKLVKVAAGIFHTHSRVADARKEIMAAYTALEGAPAATVAQVYACRTTEAAAEIINRHGLQGVYDRIVANVSQRCMDHVFNKIQIGCILFHQDYTLLAMDENARKILKETGSSYGL
ncbi:cobalt-precorrin-6A synthase [Sporotomaculum syntrophicum]|uniref:Cobalt-precorrin-5B C(1)-methyltransferase n=1 Tax=Sporotomaculum syntrophicum TaxID=182264 RepID=A0A9D2WPE6_9FIRM|nr:cobalt-precorrin-5B (C(1))-methyltransferase CbiD [Sporotomaculum syntrophicum]KAF1084501.1 cobalt-precorrin-6A synthase [Sporotomaculum syntrophicum]